MIKKNYLIHLQIIKVRIREFLIQSKSSLIQLEHSSIEFESALIA